VKLAQQVEVIEIDQAARQIGRTEQPHVKVLVLKLVESDNTCSEHQRCHPAQIITLIHWLIRINAGFAQDSAKGAKHEVVTRFAPEEEVKE